MFSNFAGEILFYKYDANRSKDGDLPGSRIIKSERIDQPYQRLPGVMLHDDTARFVGNSDPGRYLVSRRHCLALDLVNDAALIQEYCRMHEPGSVWPAVIDHIRAQGIESMEIWQRGDRLLMVMDAADDYPRSDPSEFRRVENERWEACMAT